MSQLFVDVDDTLVTWCPEGCAHEIHPYGAGSGDKWLPNAAVLAYVSRWRAENPDGRVIVWSGGGGDYARVWRDRLLPEATLAISKFPLVPDDSCTFIDDSPFDVWAHKTIHPRDLP